MFIIIVRTVVIPITVAVGATFALALRRTNFAARFCENGSRLRHFDNLVEFAPVKPDPPASRAVVDLDTLAV